MTPGCRSGDSREVSEAIATPQIVAVINGEEVRASEFQTFLDYSRGELEEDPSPVPEKELFRDFLAAKLLVQEAKKQGITVGEDEVNRFLSEWTPKDSLMEPGFPEYIYQYLLAQKVLKQEAAGTVGVTLRELQNYYEQHAEGFRVGDRARVLEILTETRAEADGIRAEVQDGDLNRFRELAQQRSIGVTALSGGVLGVYERGDLPEEFEKVIFALKPGEVTEPFHSAYGYHLFAMEEWIPAHEQKFYEVRDQIFEDLTSQKEREVVEEYISTLFEGAQIEILDDNLRFDRVERQVNEVSD